MIEQRNQAKSPMSNNDSALSNISVPINDYFEKQLKMKQRNQTANDFMKIMDIIQT